MEHFAMETTVARVLEQKQMDKPLDSELLSEHTHTYTDMDRQTRKFISSNGSNG